MAEDEIRRPRGRRGRRPGREPVPADTSGSRDFDPGDPGDDGSAGVREPRRPKPSGPVSGAGARPEPEPKVAAHLPDPRY